MIANRIAGVIAAGAVTLGVGLTTALPAGAVARHSHHHASRRPHKAGMTIPQHNGGDRDADNNGGPSDGDGNV